MNDRNKSKQDLVEELQDLRRQISQALPLSLQVLDSLGDAIHVVDRDLRILMCNSAFWRWMADLGLQDEIVGRSIGHAFTFLPAEVIDEYRRVFENGQATVGEEYHVVRDKDIWTEVRKIPISEGGSVARVLTVIRDITESKRLNGELEDQVRERTDELSNANAELKREIMGHERALDHLARSEAKYRQLFETVSDAILLFDAETKNFLDVNEAAVQLYGYSREEFLRLSHDAITAEPEESADSMARALVGELTRIPLRHHRKKDGTVFPAEISGSTFTHGDRVLLCGVVRDITERMRAEEELRRSEHFRKRIVESALNGIYVADIREKRLVYINQQYTQLTGYTLDSLNAMVPCELTDLAHPEDRERMAEFVGSAASVADGKVREIKYRFRTATGSWRWFWSREMVFERDQTGQVQQVIGTFVDVTDRVQTEAELRRSEHFAACMLESAINGVYVYDLQEQKDVYINSQYTKLTGYTLEHLQAFGPDEFLGLFHPDDRPRVFKHVEERANFADDDAMEFRFRLKTAQGQWRDYLTREMVLARDDKGQVRQMLGAFVDITEQKRNERYLRAANERLHREISERKEALAHLEESQSLLQQAERIANIGSWEWDPVSGNVTWSDQMYRMFEVDPNEFEPTYEGIIAMVHPEDRQMTRDNSAEALANEGQHTSEERIVTGAGREKILTCRSEAVRDDDGTVVRMLGTCRDVTSARRQRRQLLEFKTAVDRANFGIGSVDLEGVLTYVNDYFAQVHGYTVEELVGRHVSVFHNSDQMPRVNALLEQLRTTGFFDAEQVWHAHRSGREFMMLMSAIAVTDNEGKPQLLTASAIDITGFMEVSEELAAARIQLEQAARLAELGTLSATLAHQLNQPLTVIQVLLQSSLSGKEAKKLPASVAQNIRDGIAAVGKADKIVRRFRHAVRVPGREGIETIDVKAVAAQSVRILRHGTQKLRLEFVIEDSSGPFLARASEGDLEQVFFSLIQNAQQAAEGQPRTIRITMTSDKKAIRIVFADDCGGIEPEHVEAVFEPFFTTKPAGKGTGLGLSLTRQIVSRWGGEVSLENHPGRGATFTVTIPRA